ncbi:MAG: hypothetical protein HC782_05105 [Gammaproteobacteria bacterium]|nr:hypothetical protein [Gammaproteobacteria bacterium]
MQRSLTKQAFAVAWALPITLLGFSLAIIIRASGGQIIKRGIAWEASCGIAAKLLWLCNPWITIEAITQGHMIIARDEIVAARLRTHEHAHVRQYERWGLLFPIAYLDSKRYRHDERRRCISG